MTAPPPPSCEELVSWNTGGVQITASKSVPSGDAGPAHCKVSGVADGAIQFELLLPEEWNGRFLMGGGGGPKPTALRRPGRFSRRVAQEATWQRPRCPRR